MASYDAPQFGLYPGSKSVRVKIHQNVDTVHHGTKHMFIDHFDAAWRRTPRLVKTATKTISKKDVGIIDYGISADYQTSTSRENDWASLASSVWKMCLRRVNVALIKPSHDTWVYGVENQTVVQRLGQGDGSYPDNDDLYIIIDRQNGSNELQCYIQTRVNGATYYLILIDNRIAAPNREKLDVSDYANVYWLPADRFADAKANRQALWTITVHPEDVDATTVNPLDCKVCACPEESGKERLDQRNNFNYVLYDKFNNRKSSFKLYDEATLTGPQWAWRNGLKNSFNRRLTTADIACKTAAQGIDGGRCEAVGENELASKTEDYAEGKANVAYKFDATTAAVKQEQAAAACAALGDGWRLATRDAIEGNEEALKRSKLNGMIGSDSWQNAGSERRPNVKYGYNYLGSRNAWKRANAMDNPSLPAICMNPNVFTEYDNCTPVNLQTSALNGTDADENVTMACTSGSTGMTQSNGNCPNMKGMEALQAHIIADGIMIHQAMMAVHGTKPQHVYLTPSKDYKLREKMNLVDDTWKISVYDMGQNVYNRKDETPFKTLYMQRTSDEKFLTVDKATGAVSYDAERRSVGFIVDYRDRHDANKRVSVIRLSTGGYDDDSYLVSKGALKDAAPLESLAITSSLETATLYGWQFKEIKSDCPQAFTNGPTFPTCPALFGSKNVDKTQMYVNTDMATPQGLAFTPRNQLNNWDKLWKKCGGDGVKARVDPECANFEVTKKIIKKWDPGNESEFQKQHPTEMSDDGDSSTSQAFVRYCAQPVTVGCRPTPGKVDGKDVVTKSTSCPYIKQTGTDGTVSQSSSTAMCKAANDDPDLKRKTFVEFCQRCKKATPYHNERPNDATDDRYKGCRDVCGCILREDDKKYLSAKKTLEKALEGTGQLPNEKCGWYMPCAFAAQSTDLNNPYLIADPVDVDCPSIMSCNINQTLTAGENVILGKNASINMSAVCTQNNNDKPPVVAPQDPPTPGSKPDPPKAKPKPTNTKPDDGSTKAVMMSPLVLGVIAACVVLVIIVVAISFGGGGSNKKGLK